MAITGNPPSRRRSGAAGVSLERALSKLGLASRSQARTLIAAGRVTVDGRVITNPLLRVTPERVSIAIDGQAQRKEATVTIALHKPRGYLTTRSDPEGRTTVYDLLTDLDARVVPVGRLDLATSGLLLFTSDTQFAHWLTDPKSAIPRVYLVTVKGRMEDAPARQLMKGLIVDGERLVADAVVIRKSSNRETHLTVTLTEGKNREVRRLFDAVGHPVTQLRRVQFGGVRLGALAPGKWRALLPEELGAAFPDYSVRRRNPPSARGR